MIYLRKRSQQVALGKSALRPVGGCDSRTCQQRPLKTNLTYPNHFADANVSQRSERLGSLAALLFFRRDRLFALWIELLADSADGTIASSGSAMLAPVKNDLQM